MFEVKRNAPESRHGAEVDVTRWELIADPLTEPLTEPPQTRRLVGRPAKWTEREIVNAILYVTAMG